MRDTVEGQEFTARAALRYGADDRMYLEMVIDGESMRSSEPIPIDLQRRIEQSTTYARHRVAVAWPTKGAIA